jgi:hypothetical protein
MAKPIGAVSSSPLRMGFTSSTHPTCYVPTLACLFLLFYQVGDQVRPLDATFDRQVLLRSDIDSSCNCVYHNYAKLSTCGDLQKPRRWARRQTGASLPVTARLVQARSSRPRAPRRSEDWHYSPFHRRVRRGAYEEDWECDTGAQWGAFGEGDGFRRAPPLPTRYAIMTQFFLEGFQWHDVNMRRRRRVLRGRYPGPRDPTRSLRAAAIWGTGAPAPPCTPTA